MRLNASVKKYVPTLSEVNDVSGDNLYHVCVEIAKSEYPNKHFTIATIIAECTKLGGKLWSDHLTRCFKMKPESVETSEALATFLEQYYTLATEFETKMREAFSVPVTDAQL